MAPSRSARLLPAARSIPSWVTWCLLVLTAGQRQPSHNSPQPQVLPTKTHLDGATAQEVQVHVLSKEVTFRVGSVKLLSSHEKVRSKVVSCLKKETCLFVEHGALRSSVGTAKKSPKALSKWLSLLHTTGLYNLPLPSHR